MFQLNNEEVATKDIIHEDSITNANKQNTKIKNIVDAPKESKYPIDGVKFMYLPELFQEPQLIKFLNQFGSKVSNVVCWRHKKSKLSKGIAIVTFQNSEVIPDVIEECNGMLLGGCSIVCSRIKVSKALPPYSIVAKRKERADLIKARGKPLIRHKHNLLRNKVVKKIYDTDKTGQRELFNKVQLEQLSKVEIEQVASAMLQELKIRAEKEAKSLEKLRLRGIDYNFIGFNDQLENLKSQVDPALYEKLLNLKV